MILEPVRVIPPKELVSITDNGDGTYTYTINVTNMYRRALSHVAFELPRTNKKDHTTTVTATGYDAMGTMVTDSDRWTVTVTDVPQY